MQVFNYPYYFFILLSRMCGCVDSSTLGHHGANNPNLFSDQQFVNSLILNILTDKAQLNSHNQNINTHSSQIPLPPTPNQSGTQPQQLKFQATQGITQSAPNISQKSDKVELLKNIEKLDFRTAGNPEYYGSIKILNQSATPILQPEKVNIMTSSNFGKGRAIAFAHQKLFKQDYVLKDKNWIFLFRNILRWVTKSPLNTDKTIKIAAIGFGIIPTLKQNLKRAGLNIDISYIFELSSIDIQKFQALLIGDDILFKDFSNQDCQKVVDYVQKGGGLVTTLRGWYWKSYKEGKDCKDWINQCLQNRILRPMGMIFDENFLDGTQMQLQPDELMELEQQPIREYVRNQNFQFAVNQNEGNEQSFDIERRKLLEGVSQLQYDDAAFSSFKYPQDTFFPIILTSQNKPVMIAGYVGDGKMFLAGHGGIYQKDQTDNFKLLNNIFNWLGDGKKNCNVGLFWDVSWSHMELLNKMPIKKQVITRPDQMKDKDIICVSYFGEWPKLLTNEMISALKQYVENGGNILFASHGWVWEHYGQGSKNKSLKYQQSFVNIRIVKQFNLYLNRDFEGIGHPHRVQQTYIQQRNNTIENFLQNDLLAVLSGGQSFSASENQIKSYIQKINSSKNFSNICDIDLYHRLVDEFVTSRFNIQTNFQKILMNNVLYNNVYKLMNALSYACPPQQCRALPPSLNTYPGCAEQKLDKKTVEVYKNKNQNVYVGLYINPGEAVRISHNHSMQEIADVELAINQNLSLLGYDNGNLKRYPDISKKFKIKPKQFLIATPHGGTLYFIVQTKSTSDSPLTFEIQGAYAAPYFNENVHSQQDFNQIKKIDAPFFVFETKRFVIEGRTKKMLSSLNINIGKVCNFWNTGIQLSPFKKDSVFCDANTIVGYMHSGNPIMTQEDVTFQFIGGQGCIWKNGNWGIYHELGHNHQDSKWTANGTVEVTCNIYSLYLFWKMHGNPVFQSKWLMGDPEDHQKRFLKHVSLPQNQKLANYDADPNLGLYLYGILIDQFGFDIFSTLHKNYDKLNIYPRNDQQKYDILVEQLSLVIGFNLWNYFKKWGMPVTDQSFKKASHLKKYQCKRHPNLTS